MVATQEDDEVNRYAILVGIDAYDSEEFRALKGCVNDVTEISKALKASFGDQCRIYRFTASTSQAPKPPTESGDQWPTSSNLHASFELINKRAKQGHHVYFHFSGHSILAPLLEEHGGNWPPGNYLALVLLSDADGSQTTELHSAELAQKMRRLVEKGVSVTVVLDCCQSGSVLRGGRRTHGTEPSPVGGSMRKASMAANWLIDPKDSYAILAACDRMEDAYHAIMPDDNSRYGLLTYCLLETFCGFGGVGGRMARLVESIQAKVKDNRREHQSKTQNPVLKGNGEQAFFGCATPACIGDFPITKAFFERSRVVRLHAGCAHGIAKGDRFSLHPLSANSDVQPLTAKVTNVRGITSDLEVAGPARSADTVRTGWMATTETRLALRQFPVWLNLDEPEVREWESAMRMRPSLSQCAMQEADWTFRVTRSRENIYEVHDKDNPDKALVSVSATQDLELAIRGLLNRVEHLARFKLLRNLSNLMEDRDQQSVLDSFGVQILKKEHGKLRRFNPSCINTPRALRAACSKPGCTCVIPVIVGEELILFMENTQSDGRSLYFYVYDMCYGWEVEEQHASDRVSVAAGESCEKATQYSLEDGQDEFEDIMKVFITRETTSFRTWVMPALGRESSADELETSQERGKSDSEAWAVLTFRILVSRAESEGSKPSRDG